jgi:glycerol-3-phosphate acyltransferase PlsY
MFGHGWPPDFVDFWGGVGVGVVVELDVLGAAAACVLLALVVLVVVGAAPALAIPAAAPPVASAPATMVAPSSLEMVIRSNLLGSSDGVSTIVRALAKSQRSRA